MQQHQDMYQDLSAGDSAHNSGYRESGEETATIEAPLSFVSSVHDPPSFNSNIGECYHGTESFREPPPSSPSSTQSRPTYFDVLGAGSSLQESYAMQSEDQIQGKRRRQEDRVKLDDSNKRKPIEYKISCREGLHYCMRRIRMPWEPVDGDGYAICQRILTRLNDCARAATSGLSYNQLFYIDEENDEISIKTDHELLVATMHFRERDKAVRLIAR
eukprot:766510-Hanusia_phi.AAC.2